MARLTAAAATFSELVIEVFRLNGLALEAGDRLAKPAGLTSARWQVLGVVDHGPAPVSNVARVMGLTRQSVQQVADVLERDGFVEYAENPHHRTAKLIAITAAGREALRQIEARQAAWADRLGKQIDLPSLRAAVDALRKAREVLEQDASSPARRAQEG
ncbi:MarR family transcriptional regulator [Sorangium cellulosum]|uniref:MarR family transcriptional regulator n=1 Tax=Sorangium cellulosum TaxID=56 RepID=A0A2L0EMN8_SORCE|nr:MarR family winged helix-turn-helix transcriptional regulator [Sorangium cellulosum]AUX40522.1 MarR family transcriptional regulator [Sorangium cellulosum]